MDEATRKTLESLGWTAEILDALKQTPEHRAVDRMFQDRAENALLARGCSALEFLAANPGVSMTDLAKRLNRGASPIGILMAAYDQARVRGVVRDIAKDLLIRDLLANYTNGWTPAGDVHPFVMIGGWYSEVGAYSRSANYGRYAERIVRSLAIDHPPQEGWKPDYPNDPLIDHLFNLYWPVED
jgi:hypothetical protein